MPYGLASVSADTLVLRTTGLEPSNTGLYFQANNAVNGGAGNPFGDGLRCAGQNVVRLGVETPDGSGAASWGPGLGATGGWSPEPVTVSQTVAVSRILGGAARSASAISAALP